MNKKEILGFSVFGIVLILVSIVKNYFRTMLLTHPSGSITDKDFRQVQQIEQYFSALDYSQIIVIVIFLLFTGFFVAYGITKLRIIIPAALIVILLPYAVDFIFWPTDKSIWLLFSYNCILTFVWIGIMKLYYIASGKVKKAI